VNFGVGLLAVGDDLLIDSLDLALGIECNLCPLSLAPNFPPGM
jgi:hypothetical protein